MNEVSCFSGDWARTHDERSATLFLADRAMVAERRDAQRERQRLFFADVRARVRARLDRSRCHSALS